jgi:hypothetical protein
MMELRGQLFEQHGDQFHGVALFCRELRARGLGWQAHVYLQQQFFVQTLGAA